MQEFQAIDIGISLADIENPQVDFDGQDARLTFLYVSALDDTEGTFTKDTMTLRCLGAVAFKFQRAENEQQACGAFKVVGSDWLASHKEHDVSHFKFILNGEGVFEVLCSEIQEQ